jgi:hypothetical protein
MIIILTSGCTEFAMLMSGSSLAISQNTYAKMYNAADVLTIMKTEKSMKGHAYDNAKKVLTGLKEGKKYIYDTTINLFGNKH